MKPRKIDSILYLFMDCNRTHTQNSKSNYTSNRTLLVSGVRGSGRKSLTTLATCVGNYQFIHNESSPDMKMKGMAF